MDHPIIVGEAAFEDAVPLPESVQDVGISDFPHRGIVGWYGLDGELHLSEVQK